MKKTELRKKINVQLLVLLAMAASLLTFSACNDDDDMDDMGPDENIVELAQGTPTLSTLVTAVVAAELTATLEGEGPFTVFAPTNDAFENLPDGVLAYLLDNPTELAGVLQYHVVSGKVLSTDLSTGTVTTLNGDIEVNVGSSVTINGTSNVVTANVEATNGVVHIIDEVLIPEGFEVPKTIVDLASETEDLSTLVTALTLFPDLVSTLEGDGTFTVFAPNNEAFAALLAAIGQTDLNDIPESVVRSILEYHVISTAALMSTDLSDGQTAETVNGENITVAIDGSDVFISDSKVLTANVEASNGVVHIVENVMVPPSILPVVGTIVAPAYFNKDFSTLIAAVEAADEDILSVLLGMGAGEGLTLFAPTNAAFEAAGITELPDGATLSAVLKYHVVDGTIYAAGLPTTTTGAAEIESLGGMFYLSNKGGDAGVFINGSTQVTATDIQGSNGVVHVIDRTIMPPANNIVEIAQSFDPDEFTQLVAAVARTSGEATDLLAALSGDGDFTVFAPTDVAFQALLDSDVTWNSVDDIPLATLTAVLQHHVIASPRVFSSDLATGAVATLNGDITIDATAGTITDGSGAAANLSGEASLLNVLATNGVIHVIDKVLLP